MAQDESRLTGPGVSGQARRVRREAGEEAGDGRAEGISRRAARAALEVAGRHVRSFESSQVEVCTWRTYSIVLLGLPKQSPTNWVAWTVEMYYLTVLKTRTQSRETDSL